MSPVPYGTGLFCEDNFRLAQSTLFSSSGMLNGSMSILKLAKDNPKKELEFEIKFQLSLTTAKRFEMMFGRDALEFLKFARKHERFKTPVIVKRT